MQTIVVIDYGLSNLRSVSKALEQVSSGQQQIIVSDMPEQILKADRIVFPGQGAIGQCTASLKDKMLDQVLLEWSWVKTLSWTLSRSANVTRLQQRR